MAVSFEIEIEVLGMLLCFILQLQSRLDNITEGVSVEVMSFTEQETKIELEQVKSPQLSY